MYFSQGKCELMNFLSLLLDKIKIFTLVTVLRPTLAAKKCGKGMPRNIEVGRELVTVCCKNKNLLAATVHK
jgi:hypothetical protein